MIVPWAFSPDGKYLVGSGQPAAVYVWSVATGQLVKRLTASCQYVNKMWFSDHPLELHCQSSAGAGRSSHQRWSYPEWLAITVSEPVAADDTLTQKNTAGHRREIVVTHGYEPVVVRDLDSGADLISVPRADRRGFGELSPDGKLLLFTSGNMDDEDHRVEIWDIDGRAQDV